MVEKEGATTETTKVERTDPIYDETGTIVGTVEELTAEGFVVETFEGVATETTASDLDTERPGGEFGEGYLMWRCGACGEMGPLEDGIPAECPDCGASKAVLKTVRED